MVVKIGCIFLFKMVRKIKGKIFCKKKKSKKKQHLSKKKQYTNKEVFVII